MKLLDRYIVTTYLASLLIVLGALLGIAIVLHLFVNVGEFMEAETTDEALSFWQVVGNVATYYGYQSFDFFRMLAGPSLLIAAAATFVRFHRGHELVGMKAAGISLYRIMWPMVVVALAAVGFSIINQEHIIPRIATQLARDPDDLGEADQYDVDFVRDAHNNIIYAPRFVPKAGEMRAVPAPPGPTGEPAFRARVRIFLRDSRNRPTGVIEAERALWHGDRGEWELVGGRKFLPVATTAMLDRPPPPDRGLPVASYATNVGPELIRRQREHDFYKYLSFNELRALTADPKRGSSRALHVAMHQHATSPILMVLALLLGLPFVAGREDTNYFASIGIALALQVAVFAVTFASTAFGGAGHVDPLLAAWIPVFVVLPAAVVSMEALRT